MPWYYAGPEAKPVGPIALDELHARRQQGVIKPETYVIEQTGQPIESLTWKKYQDVFPAAATLPPIPPPAVVSPAPQMPPSPPTVQPHPLFPSAAAAGTQYPVHPSAPRPPDPYYHNVRPTNLSCGWGFALGIVSLPLALACGIGFFPAVLAVILCIVGLMQIHKRREQGGQGLAIAGLMMSAATLLVSVAFIIYLAIPMIKAHELTVTEQTSTDSE